MTVSRQDVLLVRDVAERAETVPAGA